MDSINLVVIFSFAGELHWETSSGGERSCPPQIAYGPVQLALHCCCLSSPQQLMVQAVLQDVLS